MKYKGHKLVRTPAGNYRVQMPGVYGFFLDVAANIETAKRWVDAHIVEVRERAKRRAQ